MTIHDADDLTAAVLAVMQATPDERLREIMTALARHLHAFVREVRLTEPEFREATAQLNRMGRLTTDTHNEFVLMAGSLGVSALVCLLNNTDAQRRETTQNLLGPFWRMNSPRTPNGASIVRSPTPGDALFVTFRVVDGEGAPVAGAEVDIWHCSPQGLYENQDETQADHNLRGKFTTDADGIVAFRSVKPIGYPIPIDTVVGQMLQAQGRHPFRPAQAGRVLDAICSCPPSSLHGTQAIEPKSQIVSHWGPRSSVVMQPVVAATYAPLNGFCISTGSTTVPSR